MVKEKKNCQVETQRSELPFQTISFLYRVRFQYFFLQISLQGSKVKINPNYKMATLMNSVGTQKQHIGSVIILSSISSSS